MLSGNAGNHKFADHAAVVNAGEILGVYVCVCVCWRNFVTVADLEVPYHQERLLPNAPPSTPPPLPDILPDTPVSLLLIFVVVVLNSFGEFFLVTPF